MVAPVNAVLRQVAQAQNVGACADVEIRLVGIQFVDSKLGNGTSARHEYSYKPYAGRNRKPL